MSSGEIRGVTETPLFVFGEALVDAFADGPIPGGAPFNVACHLAGLGLAPRMITRLGDDEAGAALRVAARRCGLVLDRAQRDHATARVLVHESSGGHVFEIPPEQAFDRIDAAAAVAARQAVDIPAPWLYFGTLALRTEVSREALAAVRAAGPHLAFVDLNWRDAGPPPGVVLAMLHDIEALKLSDDELARMAGWLGLAIPARLPHVGDEHPTMRALVGRTAARHLLVSHGAAGASAWDADGCCIARAVAPHLPKPIDTVGAGDAFSALMLAGLAYGHSVDGLLGQAVAFATQSCGWRGALPADATPYPPWRRALEQLGR